MRESKDESKERMEGEGKDISDTGAIVEKL